jgi:hypothetical protein
MLANHSSSFYDLNLLSLILAIIYTTYISTNRRPEHSYEKGNLITQR